MLQNDLVLHMLQYVHTYILSVCSTCFSCFRRTLQMYIPNVSAVPDDVASVSSGCCNDYTGMFQEYTSYVARSDGCCKGDETLGLGKGNGRGRARWRTGARRRWRRIEGRSVVWRGKERGGLDAGGATGMGIESWMVGHGHWRKIGHGQPDVTRWRGI